MTCSSCKQTTHNVRTCPLLNKCSLCGLSGHSNSKCSYMKIYNAVPVLPDALVSIIQTYDNETVLFESYKSYFSNKVLTKIKEKNVTIKSYYNMLRPKLLHYLYLFDKEKNKSKKIMILFDMLDYLYDFKWLLKRVHKNIISLNGFFHVMNVKMNYFIKKNNLHNVSFYLGMFD